MLAPFPEVGLPEFLASPAVWRVLVILAVWMAGVVELSVVQAVVLAFPVQP
jgi:hypothetical protein